MLCICERKMTGFICSGLLSCKLGIVSCGSTKGVQFLEQLTHCEADQEGFRTAYCVTIRIISTSRRSVRILCGRSDPFSVSYTFDGIQANETKMIVNIFVMTPVQISRGTVATADHILEPITGISLASTKLIS